MAWYNNSENSVVMDYHRAEVQRERDLERAMEDGIKFCPVCSVEIEYGETYYIFRDSKEVICCENCAEYTDTKEIKLLECTHCGQALISADEENCSELYYQIGEHVYCEDCVKSS